ncbi:MAG: helix-turn-helix transcriptional regulator [Clostridia bacterium]|nr:helix-turn-helix transcriptional regulator [Clostridia bacterium]
MSLLTADDVNKVNRFYRYINQHYEAFIINALGALNTIFGYRRTSYTIICEKSDHSPYVREIESDSISPDLLMKYKEEYFYKDPFVWEFSKRAHSAKSNCLFKLSDFMTLDEFVKTDYGRELKSANLGYFASITTAVVSGYPVYSLNVFKTLDEPDFSPKELELLELTAKAFADSFLLYKKHMELTETVDMVRNYIDMLNCGFAIADDERNIVFNNATYMFCASRITNKKDIYFINRDMLNMLEEKLGMPISEFTDSAVIETDGFTIKLTAADAIFDKNVRRHIYINIYDNKKSPSPVLTGGSTLRDESAAAEKSRFTGREKEIIALMLEGQNNQQIAAKLFISIFTVKTHIKNIFNKLDVSTRADAVAKLEAMR